MQIERIGSSTARVTNSRRYTVDYSNTLVADDGQPYFADIPYPRRPGAENSIWRIISIEVTAAIPAAPIPAAVPDDVRFPQPPVAVIPAIPTDLLTNLLTPKKDTKMLTIKKNATLLNDMDSDTLLVGTLMAHIRDEQRALDALDEYKVTSKAIDKLKKKHASNITDLVEILDARDEDSDD